MNKKLKNFLRKLTIGDILGWFKHRVYNPILKFSDRIQDYKLGIKTEEIFELPSLGINQSFGIRYETTSYKTLNHLLKFASKKRFYFHP